MFTELLSSSLRVLMAGFLYMLAGFQLSLIILASFGGYWLVHPSLGLGDLLVGALCELTKPFQAFPTCGVRDSPMEGSCHCFQQN